MRLFLSLSLFFSSFRFYFNSRKNSRCEHSEREERTDESMCFGGGLWEVEVEGFDAEWRGGSSDKFLGLNFFSSLFL
jgi:hypothetical protein